MKINFKNIRTSLEYGVSKKEVWKNMSKQERKLFEDIIAEKVHTDVLRTNIMVKKLKGKDEEEIKKISFEDCKQNLIYHAMQYKAENFDSTLSVMDLYSSGWMALDHAWEKFMNKSQSEIEYDVKNEKVVFASFKTFSKSFIKQAMALAVMRQKAIDNRLFDLPATVCYHTKNVSNTIRNCLALTGKIPNDEAIAETLDLSVRTVKNCKYVLNLVETLPENRKEVEIQIEKDFDFSTLTVEEVNPLKKRLVNQFWTEAKTLVGERSFDILTKYFVEGKTMQEIGDNLENPVSKERVRQILNIAMEQIKNSPELFEVLIESVQK